MFRLLFVVTEVPSLGHSPGLSGRNLSCSKGGGRADGPDSEEWGGPPTAEWGAVSKTREVLLYLHISFISKIIQYEESISFQSNL